MDIEQPKGKEAYEQRKQNQKKVEKKAAKKGAMQSWMKIAIGAVLAIGGIVFLGWWFASSGVGEFSVTGVCVDHSGRSAMHIHPHLTLRVNGDDQEIPSGIGIQPLCMRPLHTHDAKGTIHIESPQKHTFTLEEFFMVWGKPFSRDQILDYRIDDTHEIAMTVNGQPSDAYEKLILEDKQDIVIEYREKN